MLWSRDDLDYTTAMRADQLLLASRSALNFFFRSFFLCLFIATINLFVLVIATVRETFFCTAQLRKEFTCYSLARLDWRSVELWQVPASFLSKHQNSYKTHYYRHLDNLHLSAIKYCDLYDFLVKKCAANNT